MLRRATRKRFAKHASFLTVGMGLQAVGCGEVRYRDAIHADSPVKRVVFRGDVGIVEVVPSETVKVALAVRAPDGAALVQDNQVDGIFEVTTKCRTPILCAVDAEIHVPDGVPIEIEIDRGEVWATGAHELNVLVGEGDVDLDTQGPTTVQIGHGAARVTANGPENIRIAVANGDIDVLVVPDRWSVSVTGATEQLDGIVSDDQARSSLELVAPSGHIHVRPVITRMQDSGTP